MKLTFARLNQELSGLEVDLLGDDGLRYEDWTMTRPDVVDFFGKDAGLPLPARQGQLDRGRHLRGAAQRRRRADPRPAHRAPRRQGRPLEGPAPMTTTATRTGELCCSPTTSRTTCAPRCARCSRSTARPSGLNGLLRRRRRGVRPAVVGLRRARPARRCSCPRTLRRRRRVRSRGRGRARGDRPRAAPSPFLTSSVVATTVLVALGGDDAATCSGARRGRRDRRAAGARHRALGRARRRRRRTASRARSQRRRRRGVPGRRAPRPRPSGEAALYAVRPDPGVTSGRGPRST